MNSKDARFDRWLEDAERRHLADLTFPQVSSGLRALSSLYVERRRRIEEGGALDGAGKRAAFALFYAPIHFVLVREIVRALPGLAGDARPDAMVVDLGCGTGAAGAALASSCRDAPRIVGIDTHPWALTEASRTYRSFELRSRTIRADIATAPLPQGPATLIAAFAVNEIPEPGRDALMRRLLERAARGDRLLVVEPIARSVARWWGRWEAQAQAMGGRADEWRFRVELPPIVARLDRAARLDHRELTARSLWVPGTGP
ncbi:MAG TPA: class I SAM-dependent methyltransferase [Vicinamibacterales bacterium]|nr:class I SAM-dependent methyltransferase [Vicinamibacterales bacterium]